MFAIEAVEREQRRSWFVGGLPDSPVAETFETLRARVSEEQRRIDRLDEFDLFAQTDGREEDFIARVTDAEASQAGEMVEAVCELAKVVGPALDLKITRLDSEPHRGSNSRPDN